MPSLINNPNNMTDLAQNYRRVATGGSNYGTRRIQFYQVTVYGISDAEVAKLDNYRVVNNTEVDIDQEPEREFLGATVVEAVVRGVQEMSEIYFVGAHDTDPDGPDYNNLYLIIGVSSDTVSSGQEMEVRDGPMNYNPYFVNLVYDSVDSYTNGVNDGVDVYSVMVYGDHFSITSDNQQLPAPSRAERKAAHAAAKLARKG